MKTNLHTIKAGVLVLGECEKSLDEELAHLSQSKREFFKAQMGINKHFIADKQSFASDLSIKAIDELLKLTNFDKNELDLLIFASHTPDFYAPATSSLIHKELQLNSKTTCLDLTNYCTAFLQGLLTAFLHLENKEYKNIILVCASVKSKKIDPKDSFTYATLSDSASAFLLSKSNKKDETCFFMQELFSEFALEETFSSSSYKQGQSEFIKVNNDLFFSLVQEKFPKLLETFLNKNKALQYEYFFFHYANDFFRKKLLQNLKLDEKLCFSQSLEQFGNLDANNLSANLILFNQTKLKDGGGKKQILLASYGTGMHFMLASLRLKAFKSKIIKAK
ncbi:3-oxoacyl-ACP synthase [Campylobacter sp. MIT 19-121]|uniref:3-oxoacyl-ACP synthase n=1 Tax=Campylobacter sp. MIT 19-121 TaxID=2703906 RepID=UPI001389B663|nr:3-oxoacyl-ACP synthase [Campylobacter sp. MIT 19-121]NDJ26713.1 3-oxoacyl-ACP synthase [Campylobacter sp. MIT 19-121]